MPVVGSDTYLLVMRDHDFHRKPLRIDARTPFRPRRS